LLSGEPGIGKTRLAEEIATYARQQDVQVLIGRCWEGSGAPAFWPWVQVVRVLIQQYHADTLASDLGTGAGTIAQVIPEVWEALPHLPPAPPAEGDHARFRFFDSLTLWLKRVSTRQPLLVILDDLHWADTPSLLLLQFLARELQEARLLIIGTYRDTEVVSGHPLSEALGTLVRESQRIDLQGLTLPDVKQLVADRGLSLTELRISTLHEETEGNPFFLSEVLQLLGRDGEMSLAPFPISQGIRETIRRRLTRLSTGCRQLLIVAAVIGREFDFELLSHSYATQPSSERMQLLALVQEALTARLVSAVPDSTHSYRFVHALMRETLYEDIPLPQRTELHRQVGEALEQLYSAYVRQHLAVLADHFFQAAQGGESDKALRYAVQAGERASAFLAYEEAAQYYERALQLLPLQESTEPQRCELLLALGDVQRKAGDAGQARESFQRAAAIARKKDLPTFLARAALGFGEVWVMTGVGVVDTPLVGLLDEAVNTLGQEDSTLRAQVLARLAVELRWSDAHERRALLSQQAVEMARRLSDRATLAYTLNAWHWALWGPENLKERLVTAGEIVRLSEEEGNKAMALAGHKWRIAALLELGDIAAVDREITIVAQLAEELRQPFYRWWVKVLKTMRALLEGRLAEVEHLAQEALMLGQQVQAPDAVQAFGAHLSSLRHEEGRFQELEGAIKAFVEQHPTVLAWQGVLAYLYYESGRKAEARKEFDRLAANDFTDLSQDQQWVTTVILLAEVCAFLGDTHRAVLLYDRLYPYAARNVVVGPATACYGSAARYLGLLSTTMEHWEEATRHFEVAIEMNVRLGARLYIAWTQYDYAHMLLIRSQPGDQEQARQLLDQSLSTAQELGMVKLQSKVQSLQSEIQSPVSTKVPSSEFQVPSSEPGSQQSVASSLNDSELRTRRLADSQTPNAERRTLNASQPSLPSATNLFHQEGDHWIVTYDGRSIHLRDTKGFHHIACLLRELNREFHVLDLLAMTDHEGAPRHGTHDNATPGPILSARPVLPDQQARESYRQRLQSLRSELAEAEQLNDLGRITILRNEAHVLTQELSTAYGVRFHARTSSSEIEKARKAVAYRIRAALAKIKKAHPPLWRHLFVSIKTGVFCSYNPEKPISWEV
jgi:tetratricopeptide (TPR) repeat protein